MKIRTRFAPSPTGYLHIGGARTALFNWLYAKQHQGEYLLRIEDTDRERSKDEFTHDILSSLAWLNLDSDFEPVYQSKRTEKYQAVIEQLLHEGKAYYCYCSKQRLDELRKEQMRNKQKPRYDGHCRDLKAGHSHESSVNPVVRFRNPTEGIITIEDKVRGNVSVSNNELDDLIIARSDGSPTYHLTVVVDDIDLAITHVIRGDDHLNNSFRQYNIFQALNEPIPAYTHIPLIHGKDGKRLSKRHGAVSVSEYKKEGFLAKALLNYLARLGWSHGDQEIFSIDEMIELFNFSSVQQSAATFDLDKLLWVNQQHIKQSSGDEIKPIVEEYFASSGITISDTPSIVEIYELQKDRSKTLYEMCESSRFFYTEISTYDVKACKKYFSSNGSTILQTLSLKLASTDDWSATVLHNEIQSVADELNVKFGKVAPVLRLALTGRSASPSIDITLALLGKEKSLKRIKQAIDYIQNTV